jgi:hypothetical protein
MMSLLYSSIFCNGDLVQCPTRALATLFIYPLHAYPKQGPSFNSPTVCRTPPSLHSSCKELCLPEIFVCVEPLPRPALRFSESHLYPSTPAVSNYAIGILAIDNGRVGYGVSPLLRAPLTRTALYAGSTTLIDAGGQMATVVITMESMTASVSGVTT